MFKFLAGVAAGAALVVLGVKYDVVGKAVVGLDHLYGKVLASHLFAKLDGAVDKVVNKVETVKTKVAEDARHV